MSTLAPVLNWDVSPVADSGHQCYSCKDWIDAAKSARVLARQVALCACGQIFRRPSDLILGIRGDSARFLDETTTMSITWYHLTTSQHWSAFATLGTHMVHLGTREAALARLSEITDADSESPLYLYEVALESATELSGEIFEDKDHWPDEISDCGFAPEGWTNFVAGANRYVNAFEAPGSISVLAASSVVRVLGCTEIWPDC